MALNGVPEYWIDDLGGWTRGKGGWRPYIHLDLAPQEDRAKMTAYLTQSYVGGPTPMATPAGHLRMVGASAPSVSRWLGTQPSIRR